ncbi:UDP:flavonoid glycosyltransferase YjiC, YdhE family [Actinacidiphila yanglinensis]|uniref:UDP:flavonoid glycosyltransferase YjiC, YdhE family n=1 Tax=Actinacidiphila yanglinensis TaxID=310779 RepID=A0A1H6E457_9ACTN|nr:glycosyltransferase [Actinacidiphila yanglinensis]SEG92049.1 UDP:flavonoid glycosyltransferase YjiC, YdhE family [Actinacidiphila yanglinensis]
MRILFSSTPAHGHLLPQLPLARAFRDRGDDVSVISSASFAPMLAAERIDLLPVGPEAAELLAEAARRTGGVATEPTPAAAAEFFAGARIDLTAEEALAAARDFGPDLVVAEATDYVGPLVAAVLGVPFAKLAFGPLIPADFTDAFDAVAASRYKERGVELPTPAWYLDPCPQLLQAPDWQPPRGRLPMRPQAHRGPDTPERTPGAAGPVAEGTRVKALVSFGTQFTDPGVLRPIIEALAPAVDLVVTLGLTTTPADYGTDLAHVEFTGFRPLAELLDGVDLVITHGGAGTTLGALAHGLPLVVVPQGADQFLQAAAVARSRTGVAVPPPAAGPEAVVAAAAEVLGAPEFRGNARRAAEQMAAMPSPREVADRLASALR